ncbi:M50 family metallopeptidase [uncultured Shimia sp.]|uniref:M50 family metallopeptidase n=1 Tax=uncultured Shimia sp. TaxID=573152 RepID=UPI0025EAA6D8|nr:M50 family metallopeptidase [uncultured Shimia sp.]
MRALRTFISNHWQLLTLTLLITLLWNTDVLLPLRILTVFLHELSHAVAAIVTGGEVLGLSVSPNEGGLVTARGGNPFWITSAGYLGSLLIGAALFILALRTHWDRTIIAMFGLITLLVAAFYVRDLFALGFTLATGAAMLLASLYLSLEINDMILRTIGISSMIYAPLDIFDDTIRRAHLRSDARILAEHVGGSTLFWGGLWLVISMGVIVLTLRYGLPQNSNINRRRR